MNTKPFVALFSAVLVALVFAGLNTRSEPLAMDLPTVMTQTAKVAPVAHVPYATSDRTPRMATVTVRPSAEEIAAAMAGTDTDVVASDASDFGNELGSVLKANLPSASFSMPYYSFGRALPRMTSN